MFGFGKGKAIKEYKKKYISFGKQYGLWSQTLDRQEIKLKENQKIMMAIFVEVHRHALFAEYGEELSNMVLEKGIIPLDRNEGLMGLTKKHFDKAAKLLSQEDKTADKIIDIVLDAGSESKAWQSMINMMDD
jgi:hypothetical protein